MAQNPAAYDPTSATPYTAPPPPQIPQITAPPPVPQQDTAQPQTPSLIGGRGAGITKVATVVDSLLKGALRGRDYANQLRAYKQQRLAQGLNYNYQTARNNYLGMLKSGMDPNSKEVQEAKSAADAAWQVQQQFYQNLFGQQDGKGKGKSKSKQSSQSGSQGGADAQNPLAMWASNDPLQKLQAAVMIRQKIGPDYTGEAAMYTSPEYQRQLKLMRGDQALAEGLTQDKLDLRNLEMADVSQMTLEQKSAHEQKIAALRDRIGEAVSGYSQKQKIFDTRIGPDNHKYERYQSADGKVSDWVDTGEVRAPASQIAKPGSEQEYIERVAREAGIPEKELSAESLQQLRQSWVSSGQMGRVSEQNYIYTDKETGKVHVVKLQRTTAPQKTGTPVVHPSGTASTSSSTSGAGSAKPPAVATVPSHATASTPTAAGAGVSSDRVIGHTLSQPKAKAQATTNDSYKKMKPLFGLLDAQEQYMNEVKSDPSKATPRQDLSLVVAAVRSMNPGSVRLPQKELELEMKAGSLGDQARRWYEKAATGLLPDDQRNDLFTIVQRETTKAGESIAADWQQNMSGQPLPNDLKRFAKTSTSTPASSDPGAAETPEQKQLLDKYFPSPAQSQPQPK
jgi:hypothetical protein